MKIYRPQVDFHQYRDRRSGGGFFKFFRRKKKTRTTADSFNRWGNCPPSNPWKQKPKKNWKNIIFLILSIVFIIIWTGLIIYLPYFQIKKITVSGTRITDAQAVENYIQEELLSHNKIIPRTNYFLFPQRAVEEGTREKFGLRTVNVKKIFPREIIVEIQEKVSSLVYYTAGKYYLIGEDGKIITRILNDIEIIPESSTNTPTTTTVELLITTNTPTVSLNLSHKPEINLVKKSFPDQPIIYDRESHGETNGLIMINPDIIRGIIEWNAMFQTLTVGKIKYFERENSEAGLRVYLDCGWYILFNPKENLTAQFTNLKTILEKITPKEYVDLRFGEKIYWK